MSVDERTHGVKNTFLDATHEYLSVSDTSPIYPLTQNKLTDVDIEVAQQPSPLVQDTQLAASIRRTLGLPETHL